MKKILLIVGLAVLIAGGILASTTFKAWVVEELEGRMEKGLIWVVYASPEVPEDAIPAGSKLIIEFKAEDEDDQLLVTVMETPTFRELWTKKVDLHMDVSVEEIKGMSEGWVAGNSGEFEWESPKTDYYTVAVFPYAGESPWVVEGEIHRERPDPYPNLLGYFLIPIGAVVTIKGVTGRLLPKP